jgi:hypothetical protein
LDIEEIEFLKQENEDLKRLLAKKGSLISSDLYVEIDKLKERNRQLRLKIGEERRDSIFKISELEHQVQNLMRRNQDKQVKLDELILQNETLQEKLQSSETSEELKAELSELKENSSPAAAHSQKLTPDAATILGQLRARRKKSKIDLADLEVILEIIESGSKKIITDMT